MKPLMKQIEFKYSEEEQTLLDNSDLPDVCEKGLKGYTCKDFAINWQKMSHSFKMAAMNGTPLKAKPLNFCPRCGVSMK